jgi:hypothetical protein
MQNLISLTLTDQDLADLDQALATLRRLMGPMVALRAEQRRELKKMGPKSVAFCDLTIHVLSNNPQIVPESLNLPEAIADHRTLNQLRPRFVVLQQLAEKAKDTEMALGSDVMNACLEGYALLRTFGKEDGLKEARRNLSRRFSRSPAANEGEQAPQV